MSMASSLGSFVDINNAFAVTGGSLSMNGDEYVRCNGCGYGGCDVRVSGCGCTLHARCIQLNSDGPLQFCPQCGRSTDGLVLFSMSFREIDDASRTAASLPQQKNRGKKRKSIDGIDAAIDLGPCTTSPQFSELRTGRWSTEEMAYCDRLMAKFSEGALPVAEGTKLNEFLGNMLKSKQSRLTKKMKNAKLSTKMFQRSRGCLNLMEAREFSELEESFFSSITDLQERAEVKFHMQKEWREQFSRVCAAVNQPLDADAWFSSVEEMDRRSSRARDAARMAKRKIMMGVALHADVKNIEEGVYIEKTEVEQRVLAAGNLDDKDDTDFEKEILSMWAGKKDFPGIMDTEEQSSLLHSAPFLVKVTAYLQRHNIPFEHVDLWVPSLVPDENAETLDPDQDCRLCYAGNATTEKLIADDGKTARALTKDEKFNFFSFGDYSQKFSFSVGCGLPGRVYQSGRPTWEQSVHKAPSRHFERCGGAHQWGIKTVLGIPIASPNVGRIVVTLYSCFDRRKDEDLVARLSEEFTKLMPSPKWKLVVDIGEPEPSTPPTAGDSISISANVADQSLEFNQDVTGGTQGVVHASTTQGRDPRIDQVVAILGKYMPSDPLSPLASCVPGFMSLRLLLLRSNHSAEDVDLVRTMLDSYSSYAASGRQESDIAVMLARDFLFISQQNQQQQHQLSFLDTGNSSAIHNQPSSIQQTAANPNSGLSLFFQPSTRFSLLNSPALAPILAPELVDSLSVVSN